MPTWKRSRKSNGPKAKERRKKALERLEGRLNTINKEVERDKQMLKDYKNDKLNTFDESFVNRDKEIIKENIEKDYPRKINRIKKEIETLKQRV